MQPSLVVGLSEFIVIQGKQETGREITKVASLLGYNLIYSNASCLNFCSEPDVMH